MVKIVGIDLGTRNTGISLYNDGEISSTTLHNRISKDMNNSSVDRSALRRAKRLKKFKKKSKQELLDYCNSQLNTSFTLDDFKVITSQIFDLRLKGVKEGNLTKKELLGVIFYFTNHRQYYNISERTYEDEIAKLDYQTTLIEYLSTDKDQKLRKVNVDSKLDITGINKKISPTREMVEHELKEILDKQNHFNLEQCEYILNKVIRQRPLKSSKHLRKTDSVLFKVGYDKKKRICAIPLKGCKKSNFHFEHMRFLSNFNNLDIYVGDVKFEFTKETTKEILNIAISNSFKNDYIKAYVYYKVNGLDIDELYNCDIKAILKDCQVNDISIKYKVSDEKISHPKMKVNNLLYKVFGNKLFDENNYEIIDLFMNQIIYDKKLSIEHYKSLLDNFSKKYNLNIDQSLFRELYNFKCTSDISSLSPFHIKLMNKYLIKNISEYDSKNNVRKKFISNYYKFLRGEKVSILAIPEDDKRTSDDNIIIPLIKNGKSLTEIKHKLKNGSKISLYNDKEVSNYQVRSLVNNTIRFITSLPIGKDDEVRFNLESSRSLAKSIDDQEIDDAINLNNHYLNIFLNAIKGDLGKKYISTSFVKKVKSYLEYPTVSYYNSIKKKTEKKRKEEANKYKNELSKFYSNLKKCLVEDKVIENESWNKVNEFFKKERIAPSFEKLGMNSLNNTNYEMDHSKAHSKGGTNYYKNLNLVSKSFNSNKGTMLLYEFLTPGQKEDYDNYYKYFMCSDRNGYIKEGKGKSSAKLAKLAYISNLMKDKLQALYPNSNVVFVKNTFTSDIRKIIKLQDKDRDRASHNIEDSFSLLLYNDKNKNRYEKNKKFKQKNIVIDFSLFGSKADFEKKYNENVENFSVKVFTKKQRIRFQKDMKGNSYLRVPKLFHLESVKKHKDLANKLNNYNFFDRIISGDSFDKKLYNELLEDIKVYLHENNLDIFNEIEASFMDHIKGDREFPKKFRKVFEEYFLQSKYVTEYKSEITLLNKIKLKKGICFGSNDVYCMILKKKKQGGYGSSIVVSVRQYSRYKLSKTNKSLAEWLNLDPSYDMIIKKNDILFFGKNSEYNDFIKTRNLVKYKENVVIISACPPAAKLTGGFLYDELKINHSQLAEKNYGTGKLNYRTISDVLKGGNILKNITKNLVV
jgi:hypothetical protein